MAFDLLLHAKHVPVLPSLDYFAIFHMNDRKACEADLAPSWRDAETKACMFGFAGPSNAGSVVYAEDLFDVDMYVGESVMHAVEEEQKGINADGVFASVVQDDIGREQLGDRAATSAIPDNFKPKPAHFLRSW